MKKIFILIYIVCSVIQLNAMDKNKEIQLLRKEIDLLKKQVLILKINLQHAMVHISSESYDDDNIFNVMYDDNAYKRPLPLNIDSSGNIEFISTDDL